MLKGNEKQIAWARDCINRLTAAAKEAEVKRDRNAPYAWELVKKYTVEERAWVIIDELKTLSKDPEKAIRQINYRREHEA